MKVYNYGELVDDVNINFNDVDVKGIIDYGSSTMLPYNNPQILTIKSLFDNVVLELNLSWKCLDYEKSRVYFYIQQNKIRLSVEVFPKHYSAVKKQEMLAAASKKKRENGHSDYLDLMNMFDDIDEILNSDYPVGEVEVYDVKLTREEASTLLSLIK